MAQNCEAILCVIICILFSGTNTVVHEPKTPLFSEQKSAFPLESEPVPSREQKIHLTPAQSPVPACASEKKMFSSGLNWLRIETFSKTIELNSRTSHYIKFDYRNKTLIECPLPNKTAGLSQKAINAINRVPLWLQPNLTRIFKALGSGADRYADLILNEPNGRYIDEIAFSIASMSPELLRAHSYPHVFVDNVHILYSNDAFIDYANITDLFGPEGNYSTLVYFVNESGRRRLYTVPPEIYYWYVVHPKCSDETPTYINPSTGAQAVPPVGRFWRDYLFNHNDTTYLNYGDGTTVKFPKDAGPPLLKEKLAGVKTLWNCTSYTAPAGYNDTGYNNRRPWNFGDHAIEKVSNWVEKTLPLNVQEHPAPYSGTNPERAVQPVRIAYIHRGNCGELQDLSVAAARTALIPARSTCDFGEDHVWQEFWHNGWRHWDNWWSDSGSGINTPWIYKPGWGKVIGGIFNWKGNDYCGEQSLLYSSTANLTIIVRDSNNNPVDGAVVMLAQSWGGGIAISMWNHTDSDGKTLFKVGDGTVTYYARVDSETLGSVPASSSQVTQVLRNPVKNMNYQYVFTLPNAKPDPRPRVSPGTSPSEPLNLYRLDVKARILHTTTYSFNWLFRYYNIWRHYWEPNRATNFDFFIADEENHTHYLAGNTFQGFNIFLDVATLNTQFLVPTASSWYVVFSNKDCMFTNKTLNITVELYAYGIPLSRGWNFVSLPLVQSNTAIDMVLSSIDGKYDCVRFYNASTGSWKVWVRGRPSYLNTLTLLEHTMSFWIHTISDCVLTVSGKALAQPVSITLQPGWNMVGYPVGSERTVSAVLAGAPEPYIVQTQDITGSYRLKTLTKQDMMQPGKGFWIYVPSNWILIISP